MTHPNDFTRLDTQCFRAFVTAAETLNFTTAAKNIAMTQSGISQHIARLEAQIGAPLFNRVGKSVLLTEVGHRLCSYIECYVDRVEAFLEEIHSKTHNLSGTVRYAMPASCLLSPHLPMLLEKRRAHPGIELDISVVSNAKVYQKILSGVVDFGFVTKKNDSSALNFRMFCEEEYVLVGADRKTMSNISSASLPTLPFIKYPGVDIYSHSWLRFHFPRLVKRGMANFKIVSSINSIEGAIILLREGVGCTVIPRHCIEGLLNTNQLLVANSARTNQVAMNKIHLVTLARASLTRRVEQVIEWFMEMRH